MPDVVTAEVIGGVFAIIAAIIGATVGSRLARARWIAEQSSLWEAGLVPHKVQPSTLTLLRPDYEREHRTLPLVDGIGIFNSTEPTKLMSSFLGETELELTERDRFEFSDPEAEGQ